MESLRPLAGFQLPFQKRLSRLYNDTKKSSDFVKEPVQNEENPELKSLHRQLRIQKDRFISWGLEWSDPNQSAEIDESLSKAGLSEVVGSIMSTIKDILAEAEPLWLSSKRSVEAPRPSPDQKAPLIQWDKAKFEGLIRDLTVSIDTLYDLSRTRSSGVTPRQPSKAPTKGSSSTEEFRPFESSRLHRPKEINPQTLTHLRHKEGNHEPGTPPPREVVFMSKMAYSELTAGSTIREPWAPLLLEYATFSSIFSATGIMPPMTRFEKLSAGLQQDPQRAPGAWTGLPRLLGYFEDIENSRLGLVYRFPPSFNAVSFEGLTKNPLYNLPTLHDLLSRPGSEPPLEAKFRLAYNLTNTVFDMHTRGITHGSLESRNVCFCDTASPGSGQINGDADVRRPLISSFNLFPDDSPTTPTFSRHPLDPRLMPNSPLPKSTDERVLELYSLATILLSIGLWAKLETIIPEEGCTTIPQPVLNDLTVRCGSLYTKMVQSCWSAVETERTGRGCGEMLLSRVQVRATRFLEACCILDGVSGLEDRLDQELGAAAAPDQPTFSRSFSDYRDQKSASTPRYKQPEPPVERQEPPTRQVDTPVAPADVDMEESQAKPSNNLENKIRLYPHVPLDPEAVEKWNKVLMPQINHALRHFYRKHPESVEISLESVGSSPQKTEPTILVVCSSVGKVRAILKKRLGDLFEGPNGFPLKVCRGHVTRSCKRPTRMMKAMARRSHADNDEEVEAINPEFQERPGNGASIGAWIGDRHLPPVSFGGLLVVDDKSYGMTVHHMLDDPDRDFGTLDTMRSSGVPGRNWYADSVTDGSTLDGEIAFDLSDTESEPYSDTDITSDDEDEDDEDFEEPGDIPGIEPGCGEGYIVTQPALDDVEDGFYPDSTTQDEDHLDSYSLGEVYASSGIRRKETDGLLHEVDWALFEFAEDREPDNNSIPRASHRGHKSSKSVQDTSSSLLQPTKVASLSTLPGLSVQCVARTSGVQTGQILPALTSVKIYGRASPSHTYQVASMPAKNIVPGKPVAPLGIPGDSGAWIVGCDDGQLCGHVLAWSQRKQVAYICPMDVLLMDIAQTLEATEIKLPGGEPVFCGTVAKGSSRKVGAPKRDARDILAEALQGLGADDDDEEDGSDGGYYDEVHETGGVADDEEDSMSLPPMLVPQPEFPGHDAPRSSAAGTAGKNRAEQSSSPIRLDHQTEDLSSLGDRFGEVGVRVGSGQRIGVGG